MPRVAYVNGRYLPHSLASVHIEDRGYQFADGVYEVIAVASGRLVDEEPHLDRLDRSLHELRIPTPVSSRVALRRIMREVLRRNRIDEGSIYLQVTRGVAPRDHGFPRNAKPALVVTARRPRQSAPDLLDRGVSVITVPDIRWDRCDIKSISLLPNVLAKQKATESGAYEAWQVDEDGRVTEGSASNAWIITDAGEIVTHAPDHAILNGITRRAVRALASAEGLAMVERAFTVEEAKAAREAFLTSTTSLVTPVTRIDDTMVADGRPGPLTLKLRTLYRRHAGDEDPLP